MAYQNTYGAVQTSTVPSTDEYGNPLRPTDNYGRLAEHVDPTSAYPTTVGDHQKEHHGMLHCSGSSSSSSSEDDGVGGRRKKKSLKDKIKEKLPGNHSTEHSHAMSTTTPGSTATYKKKGVMDKIKEKLPGHH